MSGETTKCDKCGVTRIEFDPPIAVNVGEACGAVLAGNYSTGGTLTTIHNGHTVTRDAEEPPVCCLVKGHEGVHIHWQESFVRWTP